MEVKAMEEFSNRVFECTEMIVKEAKEKGYTAEELFSSVQSLNNLMEEKKNG